MAILAMCFDLMQEEIVAKFRWLGRKVGIVEEKSIDGDTNSQTEKYSNGNSKVRSFTQSSMNSDPYAAMPTQRTIIDDDHPWPKQVQTTSPRKTSPSHNIARIHPLSINIVDDGMLHQRVPTGKST